MVSKTHKAVIMATKVEFSNDVSKVITGKIIIDKNYVLRLVSCLIMIFVIGSFVTFLFPQVKKITGYVDQENQVYRTTALK
jgi:hypothetical protein